MYGCAYNFASQPASQPARQTDRQTCFDLAKAIGIICVLIGHSSFSDKANIIIYAFHMPMFFFISGYFVKKEVVPLSKWFRKKKSLLKTYFYTVIGTILFGLLLESGLSWIKNDQNLFISNFIKWVAAGTLGLGYHAEYRGEVLPAIGPIWFLLALFWAVLLLELYKRIKLPVLLSAGIVCGCALIASARFFLPWSIEEGMAASIFVACGYEYKNRQAERKKVRSHAYVYFAAVIYIALCVLLDQHIDMVDCSYPLWGIDIIGALACTITVIDICKLISIKAHCQILQIIGKQTLPILCIHTIEFNIFPWWIIKRICEIAQMDVLYRPLQAVLRIAAAVFVAVIAEKGKGLRQRRFIIDSLHCLTIRQK